MRPALVATALLIPCLALAAPADAAMAVRMVVTPSAPTVGVPATLSVVTLAPFTQKCVDDPTADYRPWSDWHGSSGPLDRLVAQAAHDGLAPIDVPLIRRGDDPTRWDGAVVFPASGEWALRMSYPSWSQAGPSAEACAGARITILVLDRLPATATSSTDPARSSALVPLVAVLLAFVWLSRRARVPL